MSPLQRLASPSGPQLRGVCKGRAGGWAGGREGQGGAHWGTPAAAGTGVLRLLAAARTGEPARGPRAVEAGSAAMPEQGDSLS